MQTCVPPEVLDDFKTFLIDMPRMDGDAMVLNESGQPAAHGDYTIFAGGKHIEFHNAELAPPAGVCGQNYTR